MDDQLLPDLLRLRGSVVAASDEFFAAKENLIKATAPVFVPDTYGAKGQVYDGWETRRRRGPRGRGPGRAAPPRVGDQAAARPRRADAGSLGSRLGDRPARRAGTGPLHRGGHRVLHRQFPAG